MTDTILEKDTLSVTVGDDHSFVCSVVTLGRTGENAVSQLEINIPEELNNFWAYLDFKKSSGKTFKTPRLTIDNNKIEYDIPGGLLDESGNIEIQLVLESEKGEVWKSATKKFVVLKSIDAGNDIPEAESFISEAQKILDETVETTNAFMAEMKEENEAFKEEVEKTLEDFDVKPSGIYAPAIPNTASGTAVALTDISPIEHTLDVKARSKNLITYPFFDKTKVQNGITFTDNGDGTVTANGTSTADAYFLVKYGSSTGVPLVVGKNYTLSGTPKGGGATTYYISLYATNNSQNVSEFGNGNKVTPTYDKYNLAINIAPNVTLENIVFKPQIEEGIVATPFAPHIADVSTANVLQYGKNIINIPDIDTTTGKTIISIPCYINAPITISCVIDNVVVSEDVWRIELVHLNGYKQYIKDSEMPSKCISYGEYETLENNPIVSINYRGSVIVSGQYKDFQVEYGTQATEYEKYICEPHKINPDGTVEGVTSIYPTTTLIPDTEGIVLDVEYYADTKKYIDNIKAELQALVLGV